MRAYLCIRQQSRANLIPIHYMRNFAKTGCRLLYSLRVLLVIYFISMTDVGLRAAASDVPVTISGSVVDSAGEPVIGATVMADGMQGRYCDRC